MDAAASGGVLTHAVVLPATALLAGAAQRAGAVHAARPGPVSEASALSLAFAHALALTQAGTLCPGAALRANAAVQLQTRRLARGALFDGLGRAAVTLALAARAGPGAILGECGADGQQAGSGHHCDEFELHNDVAFFSLCLPF